MPERGIYQVAPVWAVLAFALLSALAIFAASLNGALAGRQSGHSSAPGWRMPLVETARLMRQQRRTTLAADILLWRVGGAGLVLVALSMSAVVPFGRWTLADLGVGVVWFNAMDVMVWALVWMAGWGPNAAHSLIGGYRFLAQALAYELPLMFALTAPVVASKSLRVGDVVAAQHGLWFVVWMPVAFVVYCLAVTGFSVWGPLSPAAGADIAGGVLGELSGPDRLVMLAGRYALLSVGAAFGVALFLGGGAGPMLPAWWWMLIKTVALLTVFVAARGRVPYVRADRLVEISWLILLPATLLQVLVVAIIVAV